MQRLFTTVGCLALTGALLAGCGSSSKKKSDTSAGTGQAPATSTPATTPAAAPAAGGVVNIQMKNIAFVPSHVTAKVGQTVKWTNEDTVDHNVKATQGENFKSKDFGQGASYSYKLDKAGTISYVCTIHPNMKATIAVTK
jgi:plastocyanin